MGNPQGILIIDDKKPRLVFDGSCQLTMNSVPINHQIDRHLEPPITYAHALVRICRNIFNLRISFPRLRIYVMDDDVSSCFRIPKHHPDTISAMAYIIDNIIFISPAGFFGTNFSAQSWEPFARARMQLARHYSATNATVPVYSEYLDHVEFAPAPALGATYTRATKCTQNTGVIGPDGKRDPTEFHMYVDDNNYAETSVARTKLAMRYSIHALMTFIGETIPTRAPVIAHDKFWRATISDVRRLLGFDINSSSMLLTLPMAKRYKLVTHIDAHWIGKHQTTLQIVAQFAGTLVHVAQTTTWGRLLFSNLHRSVSDCLRKRARELLRHPKFRAMRLARDEEWQRTSMSSKLKWFNSKLGQFLWLSKACINISDDMMGEVKFLRWALLNLPWEIPLAHRIPRDWDYSEVMLASSVAAATPFNCRFGGPWIGPKTSFVALVFLVRIQTTFPSISLSLQPCSLVLPPVSWRGRNCRSTLARPIPS
jgi:hypothetical protein